MVPAVRTLTLMIYLGSPRMRSGGVEGSSSRRDLSITAILAPVFDVGARLWPAENVTPQGKLRRHQLYLYEPGCFKIGQRAKAEP